ncbi:hypothetical protein [Mycobacterium sp. RTGN5]|uniref:hypothetical protein n=1 Tax=Mycobacterium sp. RTGN5 TaxID=3016522 RepID=UPI0029C6A448|nr:hypothetical protein [Mycobacterium sp. RTGN5]
MTKTRIASTAALFTFGLAALSGIALAVAAPGNADTGASSSSGSSSTSSSSTSGTKSDTKTATKSGTPSPSAGPTSKLGSAPTSGVRSTGGALTSLGPDDWEMRSDAFPGALSEDFGHRQ